MDNQAPYRNASLDIDTRTRDLLGRMSIEEKVGQLRQILAFACYTNTNGRPSLNESFHKAMAEGVGALYGLHRADPWTKITLETGLSPQQAADLANEAQRAAVAAGRHGIPLLLAEECPHGLMAIGATMFPAPIGLASTWNAGLLREVATVIAAEICAMGANVGYGPVLDLARDPRWSRVEETFGEDPCLAARLGLAFMRALQESSARPILATLKHFAAYGETQGGHNGGCSLVGPRELYTTLLPAFEACVRAGAGSLMSSYNELDATPCTASRHLLTDILREKWGFGGMVVSDLYAIDAMTQQGVAADLAEAAAISLKAGVDLDLGANAFGPPLLEALRRGLVSAHDIDLAAGRILRAKFRLGLFECPYVEPRQAAQIVGSPRHKEVSLQAARQSIVLLKNDGALPLARQAESIAVIGPNADNLYNQLGDYTPPQDPASARTVLQAFRERAGVQVAYALGCRIRDKSRAGFDEALAAARNADAVVAVVGGSSSRYADIRCDAHGRAVVGETELADMDCGEGFDRCELDLAGVQMDLLEELHKTGRPLIVVLINGRPMILHWIMEHASAVLEAWYPGPQGGTAIVDVLLGDVNPSGKLPVSFPRTVGQLPVYYNHKPLARGKYLDADPAPLLPFGFGLSYTRFAYSRLEVGPVQPGGNVTICVDVANVGAVVGEEVVQLYLRDTVSTFMTPVKALKAFDRVSLQPGECKTVRFELTPRELAVLDENFRPIVEKGQFQVMVGGDSQNVLTASLDVLESFVP